MSEPTGAETEATSGPGWLPEWARPREQERRGLGSLRLAETTLLVLFGTLLAIATVHDVVRQTHVNHRLVADLATWRAYTGHDYHTIAVEQDVKEHSTRDTVCGNTSPGGPQQRTQLCLRMTGGVVHGRRRVSGGYYLPPHSEDHARLRYGCFGSAQEAGLCSR
ncbi:MAG TPA: hypothetical protein VHU13_06630 [Solirubrobacteraceae bacterium]|nr:hypothetical protein [Solirubrobacteraceae bacterium]